MKKYVETTWLFFTFEDESLQDVDENRSIVTHRHSVTTRHSWHIKSSSVKEALTELATFCDTNAYEVKGIIPITRAQALSVIMTDHGSAGQGGYGYGAGSGWGIEMIIGFVAIVQRVEDLDVATFNKRIEARALKKQKRELEKEIDNAQREVEDLEKALIDMETIIKQGVVETTKGILRKKTVYKVGAKEFEEKSQAEAYMRDLEKQKEDKQNKISSLRLRIAQLNDELNSINTQIMSIDPYFID